MDGISDLKMIQHAISMVSMGKSMNRDTATAAAVVQETPRVAPPPSTNRVDRYV